MIKALLKMLQLLTEYVDIGDINYNRIALKYVS